jgi:transcriptional regulator with XRE-family HTH domain
MENLKEIRKKKGYSQMALAAKVGVSLMTIRLWESGIGTPREENYQKLMEALEIIPFAEDENN